MAATVTSSPASPAAAYRPIQFTVQRSDPAFNLIEEIFIADASDVSTLGNGLQVGDVVVRYTTSFAGPVAAAVGQTILFDGDCGPYSNEVYLIRNLFTSTDNYLVLDSEDLGDFEPDPSEGGMRIWLDNYTLYLRLSIYTDPLSAPQQVDIDAHVDTDGVAVFDVSNHIQNYFRNDNLWVYGLAVGGGEIVQSAHGITGLFYRVHIAELWDLPSGEAQDPFDGDHDVQVDSAHRVAVNARHPYVDWSTADLGAYIVGGSSFERKFLTEAPRGPFSSTTGINLTMGADDRFRVHMLTPGTSQAGNDAWEVGYRLVVREVVNGAPGTTLLSKVIALDDITSAFSVAVGPADLAPFITVPSEYVAYVRDDGLSVNMSEPIHVVVDSSCRESAVPIITLNPLGGVDHYTLRGRLIENTNEGVGVNTLSTQPLKSDVRRWLASLWTKRGPVSTLRKMYSGGTGFDWQERVYKGAISVQRLSATRCAPIIIDSGTMVYNSGPNYRPITIDYRMGVDQTSQQG